MKKRILACILAVLVIASAIPVAFAHNYMLGDIDLDGEVTSADARIALRYSVDLETLTDTQLLAADVDFDGDVTSADARLILRATVDLEDLKPQHTHAFVIEEITLAATCTENGEKKLSCECGEFETEIIIAAGHIEILDEETVVAATCTENGYSGDYKCSVCDTKLREGAEITASGHTPVLDEESVKEVTCKEDGFTGNTICSTCLVKLSDGEVIPTTGEEHHIETYVSEATCSQEGYTVEKCRDCDYYLEDTYTVTADPKSHEWSEPVVTPPTCTTGGYSLLTCTVCGADMQTDILAPDGHDIVWTETPATCETEGVRDGVCHCGYEISEVLPLVPCVPGDPEVVPGSGDVYCKEVTYCTVCRKVIAENTDSRAAHTIRPNGVTPASCEEPQINHMKCQVCEYNYNVVASEGLGHTINPKSYTPATCTENGEIVYDGTCTKCGETFDDTVIIIEATKHAKSGVQSCTTSVICTTCGETVAPALGHDYKLQSAAYNKEIDTFACNRCGAATVSKLATFNALVNSIKTAAFYSSYSDSQYVAYADKTAVTTSYSRFDFGIYTSAIRDLYEDEMANTPDDYSPIRSAHILSAIPLAKKNTGDEYVVSLLEESDIDSIKIDYLTHLKASEVLSSFNPQYTNTAQAEKIASFKSFEYAGDIIKVTVDVKNEKYSVVKNLASTEKTALQKIYDLDIRDDANAFEKNENGELVLTEKEEGSGYNISMTMILKEIASDAKITYFFTADTHEPIMAIYSADITMTQTIDMIFKIGLFSLNGEIDPVITTQYTRVYFFPNFFA